MSDTICPPSADTPPVEDARAQDRRPARAAITLALVCGAQFMFILDLAIVNLAVPSIQEDLGLSPSQPQWVVVVYGLTFGGFLLLGGRTADLVGRRTVLVAGLGVFTLASLSAGLAGSFGTLVASRAVQGVGAAFAAPAALSILTSTFPEGALRNRALGVYGAVGAAAASVGLVLGGALTTGPGWPWVFLMNVPIGVGLIGLALAHLPSAPPDGHGTADVPGAAAVTAGLLALVYAINESVERGWTSRTTIGFAALGTVFLVVFAVVERRAPSPIVQRSVYRQRTLVVAMGVAALVFASFLGFNLQLTLFMQQVLGYSAIEAGLAWLATSTLAVVMGVAVAARLIGRVGAGRTLLAGQLSAAAGCCGSRGCRWTRRTPPICFPACCCSASASACPASPPRLPRSSASTGPSPVSPAGSSSRAARSAVPSVPRSSRRSSSASPTVAGTQEVPRRSPPASAGARWSRSASAWSPRSSGARSCATPSDERPPPSATRPSRLPPADRCVRAVPGA